MKEVKKSLCVQEATNVLGAFPVHWKGDRRLTSFLQHQSVQESFDITTPSSGIYGSPGRENKRGENSFTAENQAQP